MGHLPAVELLVQYSSGNTCLMHVEANIFNLVHQGVPFESVLVPSTPSVLKKGRPFIMRGPSLHCTIPTESAPSLRFLQGWAAMLPAQLLSVLHRPFCMPSSYPPFSPTRRTGHPHLWWLLQFESRATAFTSWAATPAAQDLRGGSTQRAGRRSL